MGYRVRAMVYTLSARVVITNAACWYVCSACAADDAVRFRTHVSSFSVEPKNRVPRAHKCYTWHCVCTRCAVSNTTTSRFRCKCMHYVSVLVADWSWRCRQIGSDDTTRDIRCSVETRVRRGGGEEGGSCVHLFRFFVLTTMLLMPVIVSVICIETE